MHPPSRLLPLAVFVAVIGFAGSLAAQWPPSAAPSAAPAAPPPAPSGLQPPSPVVLPPSDDAGQSPEERQTLRDLQRADREDSGRGLQYLWLEPEVGYEWVGLDALGGSSLVSGPAADGSGPTLGAAAGARFLFYTLGARFRYGWLDDFDFWSLGGEAGLRIPWGRFEPYASLGAAYVRADGFDIEQLQVPGVGANLGVGFDFFVTPVFSVGAHVEGQALWLWRDAIGDSAFYAESGSATGLQLHGGAVLGLHY